MEDILGWSSALVLVVTLWKQVVRQWRSPSAEGVSSWLFIGQAVANAGFIVYSVLLDNLVFTVVNSLLLFTSAVGLVSLSLKRRSGA